jgi:hypothetical protein
MLTKKELAVRWSCSTRTVERDVKRFGLVPADFIGHQPVFETAAIERMELRRKEHRMRQGGYAVPDTKIITVREAKRRAKGKAAA